MNLIIKKKKLIIISFLIFIILFSGKIYLIDSKKSLDNSVLVKSESIKEELTLSGKIEAEDHITLQFQTSGKVEWVGVKEGDWVKKYQAVASLNKEKLEAILRQEEQDFIAAKAEHEKYYDGRTGDSESYDQKITRTALDAAQNKAYDAFRIAQENLKDAILDSTIDGLVVKAYPSSPGVNISSTSPAKYEIVNPSTVYLKVTADQTEVVNFKEGQKGTIIFDSYPDEKIQGIISSISFSPSSEDSDTVYIIKVALPITDNSNYKYRIGMTGDIDFIIKENNNSLTVPAKYIKADDKGKYVLTGKEKNKIYIKTGIDNGKDVEVKEGLSEGSIVYD